MAASAVLSAADGLESYDERKRQYKGSHTRNARFLALHLADNHRKSAQNQTDKSHVGRQRNVPSR